MANGSVHLYFPWGLFVSAPLAYVLANSTGIFHLSFFSLCAYVYVCANALSTVIRDFALEALPSSCSLPSVCVFVTRAHCLIRTLCT